jgi:hypothetical protein
MGWSPAVGMVMVAELLLDSFSRALSDKLCTPHTA